MKPDELEPLELPEEPDPLLPELPPVPVDASSPVSPLGNVPLLLPHAMNTGTQSAPRTAIP
jgi:hypothetical protein